MNTESDTPRTDEAYNEWLESRKASDILNRMMQLERELNAAIKQRDEWFSVCTNQTRKLNDAKEEIDRIQKWATVNGVNDIIRELNEANAKIKNNPWCAACKETDCAVSLDGACAMIRKYQKSLTTETK